MLHFPEFKIPNILQLPRDAGHYNVAKPKTFRRGCSQWFELYGGNRQNIEKGMRRVWIADDDYFFLSRDQSGAEALIVAYLCEDGNYRALFKHGIKPHTFVALHVFKEQWKKHFKPEDVELACSAPIGLLKNLEFWSDLDKLIRSSDDWPSNQRYYYIAKKIVHASSYGMMGNTFLMSVLEESGGLISLTKLEADRYLLTFHSLFPEIRRWHHRVQEEIRRFKIIRNIFGYPFIVTSYITEDKWKEYYAWVPQSSVGIITAKAVTGMQKWIETERRKTVHIVADTHDSFMVMCKREDMIEADSQMEAQLNITMTSPQDGVKFTMKSESQYGKNWAPQKDKDNPDGLRPFIREKFQTVTQ